MFTRLSHDPALRRAQRDATDLPAAVLRTVPGAFAASGIFASSLAKFSGPTAKARFRSATRACRRRRHESLPASAELQVVVALPADESIPAAETIPSPTTPGSHPKGTMGFGCVFFLCVFFLFFVCCVNNN